MTEDEAWVRLGLSVGASRSDVIAAYKIRARMMHPDRFSGAPASEIRLATSEFQKLGIAQDVLIRVTSGATPPETAKQSTPAESRGADTTGKVKVDLLIAVDGGVVPVEKTAPQLMIRIPAGTQDGARLRLVGRGRPGVNGGPPGDMYVVVVVLARNDRGESSAPEPSHGADTSVEVEVDRLVALNGGVAIAGGQLSDQMIRIPAGTQDGARLRLAGRGRPGMNGGPPGDMYVIVSVRLWRPEQDTPLRAGRPLSEPRGSGRASGIAVVVGLLAFGLVIVVVGINAANSQSDAPRDADVSAESEQYVGPDANLSGSMGFRILVAEDVPCDAGETEGWWSWRIVPDIDCAVATATVSLRNERGGESVAIRYNTLKNLTGGADTTFTTGATTNGPGWANIDSIICQPV